MVVVALPMETEEIVTLPEAPVTLTVTVYFPLLPVWHTLVILTVSDAARAGAADATMTAGTAQAVPTTTVRREMGWEREGSRGLGFTGCFLHTRRQTRPRGRAGRGGATANVVDGVQVNLSGESPK